MDFIQREPFAVLDFYLDLQVNLNEMNQSIYMQRIENWNQLKKHDLTLQTRP